MCDVVHRVLKSPAAELLYDINPVNPNMLVYGFISRVDKNNLLVMLIFSSVVMFTELQSAQEAVQEDELQ